MKYCTIFIYAVHNNDTCHVIPPEIINSTPLTLVDGDVLVCLVAKGSAILQYSHHSWFCVVFKELVQSS